MKTCERKVVWGKGNPCVLEEGGELGRKNVEHLIRAKAVIHCCKLTLGTSSHRSRVGVEFRDRLGMVQVRSGQHNGQQNGEVEAGRKKDARRRGRVLSLRAGRIIAAVAVLLVVRGGAAQCGRVVIRRSRRVSSVERSEHAEMRSLSDWLLVMIDGGGNKP